MGFFDRLFGKKKQSSEEPESPVVAAPSTWKDRIASAARADSFDWGWGNPGAHQIVPAILGEAAPHFGTADRPAKIKERPDDEHIDLRGRYQDSPIRFAVWMSFGNFWAIEMKIPSVPHALYLERDLEKVPQVGDEDDPFDDDEAKRVFVAKGIYFEGDAEDVAQKLSLWTALPEASRESILAGMERLDANALVVAGDSINFNQSPGLPELDDPIAYMRACADLLADTRDAVAAASWPTLEELIAGAGGGEVVSSQVSCSYCSSLYVITPSHPRCPNCGAPPRA